MHLPYLRRVRERALLTQRELAARAGLTQATVHRIESGATRARISTVRRLAGALRVDPKVLMEGGREETNGTDSSG
ncbi:MAG: helix-turn-helix domain-containing protein [Chloroflexota bacterium]|nr:helix-turn-helix domain-containing protein [Chloroflexota bacterium]